MENKKPQKPKGVGHFQNFDFCVCPRKNVAKRDASGKKGMLPCYNYVLSRLQSIWLISGQKCVKTVFGKKLQESMG